jgi:hypothetical protein
VLLEDVGEVLAIVEPIDFNADGAASVAVLVAAVPSALPPKFIETLEFMPFAACFPALPVALTPVLILPDDAALAPVLFVDDVIADFADSPCPAVVLTSGVLEDLLPIEAMPPVMPAAIPVQPAA